MSHPNNGPLSFQHEEEANGLIIVVEDEAIGRSSKLWRPARWAWSRSPSTWTNCIMPSANSLSTPLARRERKTDRISGNYFEHRAHEIVTQKHLMDQRDFFICQAHTLNEIQKEPN